VCQDYGQEKLRKKKKKGKMLVRNPRCQHEAFQITFPRVS
jgi:hypothetical protein